jgi:hypothetical protein
MEVPFPEKALKLAALDTLLTAAPEPGSLEEDAACSLALKEGRIVPPQDAPAVMKYGLSAKILKGHFASKRVALSIPISILLKSPKWYMYPTIRPNHIDKLKKKIEKIAIRINGYHLRLIWMGRQHSPYVCSGVAMHSMTRSQKSIGHRPIENWSKLARPHTTVNSVSAKKPSMKNLKK